MNKILLLDLDGTIRRPKSGEEFISHPLDQEAIPGALPAAEFFNQKGWVLIGITNQAGVEAGYKSLQECIDEQLYALELFPLQVIYFCPDWGNTCWRVDRVKAYKVQISRQCGSFRKPAPGMILAAAWLEPEFETEGLIWMVGDRPEDEQAAKAAGINFCPAEAWRDRFLPGIHEHTLTKEQINFLEGL